MRAFSIFCFNDSGAILDATNEAAHILGYECGDQLLGLNIRSFVSSELYLDMPFYIQLSVPKLSTSVWIDAFIFYQELSQIYVCLFRSISDLRLLADRFTPTPLVPHIVPNPNSPFKISCGTEEDAGNSPPPTLSSKGRPSVLISLSAHGVINHVYPRKIFLGWTPEEMSNQSIMRFIHNEDAIVFCQSMSLAVKKSSTVCHFRWILSDSLTKTSPTGSELVKNDGGVLSVSPASVESKGDTEVNMESDQIHAWLEMTSIRHDMELILLVYELEPEKNSSPAAGLGATLEEDFSKCKKVIFKPTGIWAVVSAYENSLFMKITRTKQMIYSLYATAEELLNHIRVRDSSILCDGEISFLLESKSSTFKNAGSFIFKVHRYQVSGRQRVGWNITCSFRIYFG